MPQLMLAFDLPEESIESQEASTAHDAWGALRDIKRLIRDHEKHAGKMPQEVIIFMDAVKDIIYDFPDPIDN